MSTQSARARRRIAILACLLLAFGVLNAFPGTPFGIKAANASVSAGDVVFERWTPGGIYEIAKRDSGGTVTNLSTNSDGLDHAPAVSPDGSRIAFIGKRNVPGHAWSRRVLMVMSSDGSNQGALITPTSADFYNETDGAPAWSPDGTKIAFTRQVGNDHFIAVINVDGSGEQILTSGGTEYGVSWSPSGINKLVYDSYDSSSGKQKLYIMDADGSNQQLLGSGHLAWSQALSPS